MKSFAFLFLRGAAAALIAGAVACSDAETDNRAQNGLDAAPVASWSIAPQGDLNGFFDCLAAEGMSLISAHRGGPYPGYPENALETMAALLAEMPAIMEIDLAQSADGVLYLMHDATLGRTTTGAGEVDSLPWADIKKLRLEDNDGTETPFAPTRFSDALAWAEGRTIVQLDIKPSARYEDVAAEIKNQDAEDRVMLIASSLASAKKLHRLLPRTMISLSLASQSELNRAVASGVPGERLLAFTGTQAPNPRLYSVLEGQDIEVIFGTLGGPGSIDGDIARSGEDARYSEIARMGVDIIATDRPREAHAALLAAGRAPEDGACGVSKP